MQTFTVYDQSKNYPLHLLFVWGRPYTYLNQVLNGNESYRVTVQHDEGYNKVPGLPSSLHSWMSFLDSNIFPYSVWTWAYESKTIVCNRRRDWKVLNLWIWNILFISFHKKIKCLKLKVDLKNKWSINKFTTELLSNIPKTPLSAVFLPSFYKSLENDIYVAPPCKRWIMYHNVPILQP